MTKKDRFVCWLPCKPYVKQFLLYNFNAPDDTWTEIVNLSPDKELQNDFLSRLAKPGRYENRYRNLARYTANVAVEIRRDDFYRYGWDVEYRSGGVRQQGGKTDQADAFPLSRHPCQYRNPTLNRHPQLSKQLRL